MGRAENARVPDKDISLKAINYANHSDWDSIPSGPYPEQVVAETNEDLELLCSALREAGVEVVRPTPLNTASKHGNGHWEANGYYTYCPRDSVLSFGHHLIESPMPLRARQGETECFRSLFLRAMQSGANWVSAPRPLLLDECYDVSDVQPDKLTLRESEPCFDAANILKCGRDLFYLISNSGNKLGAQWLQNFLGSEFRVHTLEGIYSYMHLDSTISLLRPGLVLLNPARISKDTVPAPLDTWEPIWCPEPVDIGYYGSYCHSSTWIGMNLLMVNPNLAIVEKNQLPLIRLLEKHRIDVIALPTRHSRTLGGGFHCVTLDLLREGNPESYFS